jgi:hypothetical protein
MPADLGNGCERASEVEASAGHNSEESHNLRRGRHVRVSGCVIFPQANTPMANGNSREHSLYVSLVSHPIISGFERALAAAQLLLLKGEGAVIPEARDTGEHEAWSPLKTLLHSPVTLRATG